MRDVFYREHIDMLCQPPMLRRRDRPCLTSAPFAGVGYSFRLVASTVNTRGVVTPDIPPPTAFTADRCADGVSQSSAEKRS